MYGNNGWNRAENKCYPTEKGRNNCKICGWMIRHWFENDLMFYSHHKLDSTAPVSYTHLNQIVLYAARHIEIVKGPTGERLHSLVIPLFLVSDVHLVSLLVGKV